MLNLTKQQIQDRWDSLSQELRDAIFSEDNNSLIDSISDEYILTGKQTDKLSIIISDVIFGFISIDEAGKQIKSELGLEESEVAEVFAKINLKIFGPIRDLIEKNYRPIVEGEISVPVTVEKTISDTASVISESLPKKIEFAEIKNEPTSPMSEAPVAFENIVKAGQQKAEEKPAMPFMLHQEEEVKPIVSSKKSLGGLFGLFSKKPQGVESRKTVVAQVDFGGEETTQIDIPVSQKISTKREDNLKEIHYEQAEKAPFVFGGESKNAVENIPSEKLEMPVSSAQNNQIKTEEKPITPEIIKPIITSDKNLAASIETPKVVNFGADEAKTDLNSVDGKINPTMPISTGPVVEPKNEISMPMPTPSFSSVKPIISEPTIINNTPKNINEFPSVIKTELPSEVKINEPVKRVDFSEADLKKPEIEIKPAINNLREVKPATFENKEINKNIEPIQSSFSVSQPINSSTIKMEEKKSEVIIEEKPIEVSKPSEAKPEDDIIDLRTFKIGK